MVRAGERAAPSGSAGPDEEEVVDPREQKLHGDADKQKAEDARHRIDSTTPEEPDHRARRPKDNEGNDQGERHSDDNPRVNDHPLLGVPALDLGGGAQHHGDRARPGQARHGNRGERNVDILILCKLGTGEL